MRCARRVRRRSSQRGRSGPMASNEALIDAAPEMVFAVLSDAVCCPRWVVGARKIRPPSGVAESAVQPKLVAVRVPERPRRRGPRAARRSQPAREHDGQPDPALGVADDPDRAADRPPRTRPARGVPAAELPARLGHAGTRRSTTRAGRWTRSPSASAGRCRPAWSGTPSAAARRCWPRARRRFAAPWRWRRGSTRPTSPPVSTASGS